MFGLKLDKELNYRLVALIKGDAIYCGTYSSGSDGEYITALDSGERFYSIEAFLQSQYGMRHFIPDYDFVIYDEDEGIWMPLIMFVVRE